MANLVKTIIENDRGEIKRLEKMADKVFAYEIKWQRCLMTN